jgi:hypothetical protein
MEGWEGGRARGRGEEGRGKEGEGEGRKGRGEGPLYIDMTCRRSSGFGGGGIVAL